MERSDIQKECCDIFVIKIFNALRFCLICSDVVHNKILELINRFLFQPF